MLPSSSPTQSSNKRLLRALGGHSVDRPPFWFMRQAGRYLPEYRELRQRAKDFMSFCYSPALAAEATVQPIRRFGMDAAIIFSDILVIADALGQKVNFESGHGPMLEALKGPADVAALSTSRLRTRLGPVYDALALTRTKLDRETALIGFAGAPWTIACYMIEGAGSPTFSKAKAWIYRHPEQTSRLFDLLVAAISEHLIAQVEAGAETLQIFDSWAGVLPALEFERWSVEPTMRIVARVKSAHPHVPVIGFPNRCGATIAHYARMTAVDAVQIDSGTPIGWARGQVPATTAIQGNLDPQLLVAGGPAMLNEAERICRAMAGQPFVFNLGHGIVPETPPENVGQLSALLRGERPA
ncbi:MAG: uroporphyrinogen decarboxylase [Gemmatimonas sp.]